MNHRRRHPLSVSIASLALLVSTHLLAQSYGTGDQVLTLSTTDFQAFTNQSFIHQFNGYLSGTGYYLASINLPDGAFVTEICLDAFVEGAPLEGVSLSAHTHGLSLDPGIGPTTETWAGVTTHFSGYGSVCTDVSHTVRGVVDSGSGPVSYRDRIMVTIADAQAMLGGARIAWHRQVSPAPASSSFGDVPTSDGAFQFIQALVASGVTAGCGGGNYCPDAPLTRRQMAVFLSKALGLHWSN